MFISTHFLKIRILRQTVGILLAFCWKSSLN